METKEVEKMSLSQPTINALSAELQLDKYPPTRFMGSKNKLLQHIWEASSNHSFETVIDLFSGSGVVSYMYKAHGKTVISNDYMAMGGIITKALIENNNTTLSLDEAQELMYENTVTDNFVLNTFKGIYFSDEDNHFIDVVRTNIKNLQNE